MELSWDNVLLAFALTLFAGLSTGIGSAIAFLTKKTNKKFLSLSLGFSAGVMIYVSFVEIFPTAQEALRENYSEKIADVTHNTPPEKSYYRVFTARLSGYGKYRRGYLPPITSSSRLTNRAKKGKISRVNLNGFCGVCPSVGQRAATMFLREAPRTESRKSISRKQTKKHNTTGCGAVGSAGGLGA